MINSTLTKPVIGTKNSKEQISISNFLDASPSGFAIMKMEEGKLAYFNDTVLSLFQCEPFALSQPFPNATLLRIQERKFADQWKNCLCQLALEGQSTINCTIKSVYGDRRMLSLTLWNIDSTQSALTGIKIEDITQLQQLKEESNQHIKII